MALPYERKSSLSSPDLHPGGAWRRNSGPRVETEHAVNDSGPQVPVCSFGGCVGLCVRHRPFLSPPRTSTVGEGHGGHPGRRRGGRRTSPLSVLSTPTPLPLSPSSLGLPVPQAFQPLCFRPSPNLCLRGDPGGCGRHDTRPSRQSPGTSLWPGLWSTATRWSSRVQRSDPASCALAYFYRLRPGCTSASPEGLGSCWGH